MMILPEIVLLDTLSAALKFVRKDYQDQVDKTQSYLHLLLNGSKIERYDLYKQAQTVICGGKDSPRLFEIDLMFNRDRNGAPTAHITLPSEMTAQGMQSMGSGEGDDTPLFQDGNDAQDIAGSSRPIFNRRLQTTFNVVITSDNSNEVILLYHFLRAMLIAVIPHLHEKGLQNISFGGQDIQPYDELSSRLYMRAVTVSLQYETKVPSIFLKEMGHDVVTNGEPKNP